MSAKTGMATETTGRKDDTLLSFLLAIVWISPFSFVLFFFYYILVDGSQLFWFSNYQLRVRVTCH